MSDFQSLALGGQAWALFLAVAVTPRVSVTNPGFSVIPRSVFSTRLIKVTAAFS